MRHEQMAFGPALAESPPPRSFLSAVERLLPVVWLGLALLVLSPLSGRWRSAFPIGAQPAATVPLFNIWTCWWNADRLRHGLVDYWQAPIFHPTAGAFAFSEPQPLLMAVAPLTAAASPTLAYNVFLLASLALNAWFGHRLLRQLGQNRWLSAVGGTLCLLLPFVHWQLGVLQLVPLWGVLWTLCELDRLAESPDGRTGMRLGAALGITYLLCNYYGLFLSVLLATCGTWRLGRRLRERSTWRAGAIAVATASLFIAPIAAAQTYYLGLHQFQRELSVAASLSPTWGDYALPRGWLGDRVAHLTHWSPRWRFNPGYLVTLLAAAGLAAGAVRPERRRRVIWMGLFIVTSLLLASAPIIGGSDWTLQGLFARCWPGFQHIRTPYRFVVFAQLATVVLAMEGLAWMACTGARGLGSRTGFALTGGLALLTIVESLPPRLQVSDVPATADRTHWAHWLRDHTPREAVVVGVPFQSGKSEADHEVSARAMFHQTLHHRRLVEGYSGFFPQTFRDLRGLMQAFPDEESLARLELFGVRYVVVDAAVLAPLVRRALADWPGRLVLRYADVPRDVEIYELVPRAGRREN